MDSIKNNNQIKEARLNHGADERKLIHGEDERKLIHGGDIYTAKKLLNSMENPPVIMDFSANINPLGLPEGVKKAIQASVDQFNAYPDPLCRELVSQLSAHEGVPEEWLLCGNGAADLIYRTAYARKPKKAMVLSPTFAEYEEALGIVDCQVIHYPLTEQNDFQVEAGILDALEEDIEMLFLCNPNNPTGQLMTKEFVFKILQRCRTLGILLFVDECFNDFLEQPELYSVKEYLAEFDNLIILKAFTKIYAMAGIRLGHCITSNRQLLSELRKAGQPWSASIPAQVAGIQAIKDKDYLIKTKELIQMERDYLIPNLEKTGIKVIASNANYIFLKDSCETKKPLHELLFEKGILIRNCDNYYGLGPGYYRICIKKHEENVKLIDVLREIKG